MDERERFETWNGAGDECSCAECTEQRWKGWQAARAGHSRRIDMLQREQKRFREPERTILCDILANCALLPDPEGARYGTDNKEISEHSAP